MLSKLMTVFMTLIATATLGAAAALAWPAETTRELAIREGPSYDYPSIQVIPPGVVVRVQHCGVEGAWCRVVAENGASGFLRRQYLAPIEERRYYRELPPPPPPPAYIEVYPRRPYYYRRW